VILPVALVLGLVFGIGYIFGKRALLRGVDDPAEVERLFGLATLAAIPFTVMQRRLERSGRQRHRMEVLAKSEANDLATEAFRSLRTSLHFSMIDAPNNVILITGPAPALGKSFISVNLAAVLAQAGKKVVVLDADLRRGHLHNHFGVDNAPGISDYLIKDADQAAVIRNCDIQGLHFVSRGTHPPNPAELLMNPKFAELVRELSSRYDYVLIDSPPVLAVADTSILGRLAGYVLLVLKSAEHPVREIDDTIKRLANAHVKVNAVIFNQVGAKIGSIGYGNYGYSYYHYQ
jgi:tyrosine-protein kinase Etk/Wzc